MAEQRKFQAIKGVRDILPPESALWNRVEQTAREVFATYGYGEIRLPIFEYAALFARSVGAETEIVSKETYTFPDLATTFYEFQIEGGKPEYRVSQRQDPGELSYVTLRPEATASVCRAYIEHGKHTWPGNVKLYYIGPMFRREKPQKGRYRQFYQIGAEVLTPAPRREETREDRRADAAIDAEVIEMLMAFFGKVGLGERPNAHVGAGLALPRQRDPRVAPTGSKAEGVTLHINSIGCKECRPKYVAKLKGALIEHINELKADSQRRVETNPLRVLDSKLTEEQAVIEKLPRITEHLCAACREHYAEVKKQLEMRGVVFLENWRLVRGLDYYMRTTFEITAPGLGAQDAVCGGGRYDGLVELLGGPPTKGIGFAIGTDRLILSLQQSAGAGQAPPLRLSERGLDVFVAWMGMSAQPVAVKLARTLRDAGFSVEVPADEMKFKKSIGLADKLGARYALIIGENEIKEGKYALKRLSDGHQESLREGELLAHLREEKAF
jgi:histidyl-tRNA synthetase